MRIFCLLFFALAVSASFSVHEETFSATRKLQSLHSRLAEHFDRVHPPMHLFANSTVQALCVEAWRNVSEVFNSSCGEVLVLYGGDLTGVDVASVINNYCVVPSANGTSCYQAVTRVLSKFGEYCSADGLHVFNQTDKDNLNMWLVGAKLPCIQSNGTFCYPIFRSAVLTLSDPTTNYTQAVLGQICDDCVIKILRELARFAPRDFVYASVTMNTACTKIDNDYCLPTFLSATKSVTDIRVPSQVSLACDKCTILVAWRFYWNQVFGLNQTKANEIAMFLEGSAYWCQKNFNNEWCSVIIGNYNYTKIAAACATAYPNCVGSRCQSEFQAFQKYAGCCWGTWFDYLEWTYTYEPSKYSLQYPPSTLENFATQICQVKIPPSCVIQKIKWILTTYNIDGTWANNNPEQVKEILLNITAYVLAIDAVKISQIIMDINSANNSVSFQAMVTPDNTAEVQRIVHLLQDPNTMNHADDFSSLVALDGRANLTEPVQFQASSITVGNFGMRLIPSFSLMLFLFLFARFV